MGFTLCRLPLSVAILEAPPRQNAVSQPMTGQEAFANCKSQSNSAFCSAIAMSCRPNSIRYMFCPQSNQDSVTSDSHYVELAALRRFLIQSARYEPEAIRRKQQLHSMYAQVICNIWPAIPTSHCRNGVRNDHFRTRHYLFIRCRDHFLVQRDESVPLGSIAGSFFHGSRVKPAIPCEKSPGSTNFVPQVTVFLFVAPCTALSGHAVAPFVLFGKSHPDATLTSAD
jgi:hypothetical protein